VEGRAARRFYRPVTLHRARCAPRKQVGLDNARVRGRGELRIANCELRINYGGDSVLAQLVALARRSANSADGDSTNRAGETIHFGELTRITGRGRVAHSSQRAIFVGSIARYDNTRARNTNAGFSLT